MKKGMWKMRKGIVTLIIADNQYEKMNHDVYVHCIYLVKISQSLQSFSDNADFF